MVTQQCRYALLSPRGHAIPSAPLIMSGRTRTTVRRFGSIPQFSGPTSDWCKHGAGDIPPCSDLCQTQLVGSDVSTEPSEAEGLSIQTLSGDGPSANPYQPCASRADHELNASTSTRKGRKGSFPGLPNQDHLLVVQLRSDLLLVGVFDGHGLDGHHSANYVRRFVERNAKSLGSKSGSALIDSLKYFFLHVQAMLETQGLAHYSGTTATVALLDSAAGVITAAHVGDSTLVVVKGSDVVGITRDHRVDEDAERRILASGGEVRTGRLGDTKTRRIYARGSEFPGLAMARCLGDQEAQRLGASHEPEITVLPFCSDSTLIVASDGLWDMISPESVASWCFGHAIAASGSGEERVASLASILTIEAVGRYNPAADIDDVTAVVVKLAPHS